MRSTTSRLRIFCLVVTLVGAAISGTAWSQPGSLLSHRKISDTVNFPGSPIDDDDEFGGAAVSLGDLDGAGPSVVAMAVGVTGDDDGGLDRGAVYVLFLDGSGTVLSSRKISDTVNFPGSPLDNTDEFGAAVAWLGDLDGPGPSAAALAVTATLDDDGGTDRGATYVLFLDSSGTVLSSQKISDAVNFPGAPLDNGDEFGDGVVHLGDLDGAGPSVAALAVGTASDDDGGTNRGSVYVLFLSASATVLSSQKISDTAGNFTATLDNADQFGSALAHLGDLDGAGPSVAAMAVTAPRDDDGGTDRGATYVLFLNSSGSVISHQKINDTEGNFTATLDDADEFGSSVASLGDLDGSGPSVGAMAIGTIGDDDAGVDRGATYLAFLNGSGSVISHRKFSDTSDFPAKLDNLDEFGTCVAALGDIDGPGPAAQTLIAGASFDDDGGLDRGALYMMYLAGASELSIDDVSAAEGNAGTTTFSFTVSLSGPRNQTVTVDYQTADSTATVANNDYDKSSGTLTFPAMGAEPETVTVLVNGDLTNEANEVFVVNLSNPVGATIADGQGVGTIQNDDGAPTLSINDVSAEEGNAGSTTFSFTVSLSNPSDQVVTVDYQTADSTATVSDDDYEKASGTLTFPAKSAEPETVTVLVNGDLVPEADELFVVNLSNPAGATIADGQGEGTIENDDGPTAVGDPLVTEFALGRVTPNPTQRIMRIDYVVPAHARVRLRVLDLQGHEVAVLAEGTRAPGRYEGIWNGRIGQRKAPAGVYFVHFQAPGRSMVKRLVLAP